MNGAGISKRVFVVVAELAMEAKEVAEAAQQLQKEVETERIREVKETLEQL